MAFAVTGLACLVLIGGCRRSGDCQRPPRQADAAARAQEEAVRREAETYLAAGQAAEARGDYRLAAQQYERAVQRMPEDVDALYRLGVARSRQRDTDAVAIWRRYLALTNDSAAGWANLGYAYELLGDDGEAEAAYLRGIERDPSNEAVRVNYGMFLARRGEIEAALEHLTQVLSPAQSWHNIGAALEREGDIQGAARAYRRALRHDPEFEYARLRLEAISQTPATNESGGR